MAMTETWKVQMLEHQAYLVVYKKGPETASKCTTGSSRRTTSYLHTLPIAQSTWQA